jgi:hypothetical protein
MMKEHQTRLFGIFASNMASMFGFLVLGGAYVAAITYIENIYVAGAISLGVPLAFITKFVWEQSKNQLERQLYEEKRIAERLSRDD